MNTKTTSIFALVLLLIFPAVVTLVVWSGLRQLDLDIRLVMEEFGETRRLRPIETNLNVARILLEQDAAASHASALQRLRLAEQELIAYLSEQYNDSADSDHQADESLHASNALLGLRDLIGSQWEKLTAQQRADTLQAIEGNIANLYGDADSGVRSVPALARISHNRTLYAAFGVSMAATGVCVGFSWLLLRSVRRRLLLMKHSIETQGKIESRDDPRDVDTAISQLESLNDQMLKSIQEKNRELLRRERMAGIGLLAADVAHEINNPMNAMLGLSELSLQTIERSPLDGHARGELRESLTVICRELIRCRGIIERLMAMVRIGSKPHWFDINQLLSESIAVAKAARPDKAACFHLLGSDRSLRGYAPSQEVRQILLTLLINAADAIGENGRVEVDATHAQREIWIRVRDNGRGFTSDMHDDFSVPFKTNRAERGGTGLGLSIAYTLAREIGAELRAESDGFGTGSLFLVAIPDTEQES